MANASLYDRVELRSAYKVYFLWMIYFLRYDLATDISRYSSFVQVFSSACEFLFDVYDERDAPSGLPIQCISNMRTRPCGCLLRWFFRSRRGSLLQLLDAFYCIYICNIIMCSKCL